VPNEIGNATYNLYRIRQQMNGVAVNGDLPHCKQNGNEGDRPKPAWQFQDFRPLARHFNSAFPLSK
jgi:hypothetical protein